MNRPTEAVLVGTGGAAIAGLFGSILGLTAPAAVVGAANGAISGWRRTYRWRSWQGPLAFGLDSSWALLTTTAALGAHGVAAVKRDSTYSASLSERQNRHVYGKGMVLRKGFATTYGNTICGAGDTDTPRRVRLVTDHENVHVWQARWFGPLFPVLYGAWMGGGGAVGALLWIGGVRRGSLAKTIESCAYYLNPFEWWAYSRDATWPPSGLIDRFGPRRPIVRSFASRRTPPSDSAVV